MASKRCTRWNRVRGAAAVVLLAGLAAGLMDWRWLLREHSQDKVIVAAAARHGVDPALVKAVVWRESWFDPRAVGRAGEVGLMQIMENTGLDWAGEQGVRNFDHPQLFDPGSNTLCGTWYLAKLLRRYPATDDPVPYALADYNAGRGNVLKWAKGAAATNSSVFIEAIGFPSTRDYVRKVMARRPHYTGDFARRP